MQGQKNQFTRKQRKLFSRDRSGVGLNRNTSRLKSKQSEDRLVSDHNSPKPKYLILGLRNELTSLREEVAKLSQRDKATTQQQNPIILEYKSQNPKDKKNPHHLDQSRSQSRRKQAKNITQSKPLQEPLHFKSQEDQESIEIRSLAVQLKKSLKTNNELEKINQSLRSEMKLIREQLRGQEEVRLKMLQNERVKSEEKENDRTVVIQKQNIEQQEVIQELRENITSVTRSNAHLQEEVTKLQRDINIMKKSEQDLLEKREEISRIAQALKISEENNQELISIEKENSIKIQQLTSTIAELELEKKKTDLLQKELKDRCGDLEAQKEILKKKVDYYEAQERLKMDERSKVKIKQLEGIIRMQEKSLSNYESDMRYLQKQLRRASFLRSHNHDLNLLVEDLTSECLKLQCQRLNTKYSR